MESVSVASLPLHPIYCQSLLLCLQGRKNVLHFLARSFPTSNSTHADGFQNALAIVFTLPDFFGGGGGGGGGGGAGGGGRGLGVGTR